MNVQQLELNVNQPITGGPGLKALDPSAPKRVDNKDNVMQIVHY